uniref:Uncharacterized protein n=1 Tax=Romanomermis culicivorax TaxID=13658 RepID=A0A915JIP1_ROMCU
MFFEAKSSVIACEVVISDAAAVDDLIFSRHILLQLPIIYHDLFTISLMEEVTFIFTTTLNTATAIVLHAYLPKKLPTLETHSESFEKKDSQSTKHPLFRPAEGGSLHFPCMPIRYQYPLKKCGIRLFHPPNRQRIRGCIRRQDPPPPIRPYPQSASACELHRLVIPV